MQKEIKLNEKINWYDFRQDLESMLNSVKSKEQLEQFLTSMYTLLRNHSIYYINEKDK